MAVGGISIDINTDELRELRDRIRNFLPNKQAAQVLAPVIRKAIQPMVRRLREISPVGPTGNLKRAASSKVVTYKQDGVAVGLVGYRRAGRGAAASAAGGSVRAGPDRAFHQYWLERGTQDRTNFKPKRRVYARKSPTKPFVRVRNGQQETVQGKGVLHMVEEQTETYIASSFNKLGPFTIKKSIGRDGRVETDPGYPRAFFRKSKTPIVLAGVTPGGSQGRPPLRSAFEDTRGEIAAIMERELKITIEQAWAALRYRDAGTVSGTDTL
jgi:hypothetical protein